MDGKWSNFNDMWCSATEMGASHWLVLKFTEPLRIHKVIIRHAGVFADGRKYNTADFRLQRADSMDGLWVDLVPPVTGNEQNVTTHTFAAVPIHFCDSLLPKGNHPVISRLGSTRLRPTLTSVHCHSGSVQLADLRNQMLGKARTRCFAHREIPEEWRASGGAGLRSVSGQTATGDNEAGITCREPGRGPLGRGMEKGRWLAGFLCPTRPVALILL